MSYTNQMASDEFYAELDSGIRFPVRLLHSHGIATGQSCEGGEGHAYFVPTIDLPDAEPAFAAADYLCECGLPVMAVSRFWDYEGGLPLAPIWRITFTRDMPERADELPMFVWGYIAVDGRDS